jgi:hypothetical protein
MKNDLCERARHHGSKSIYAGDEPRNHELTKHWPKQKRQRQKISKRDVKRKRKRRAQQRAVRAAYQTRLAAPWALVRKGEQKEGRSVSQAWAAQRNHRTVASMTVAMNCVPWLPRGGTITKHQPKR